MYWISVLFAIAAGAANPFQAGTNAELNKRVDAPLYAGLWVYLSGLLGVLALLLLLTHWRRSSFAAVAQWPSHFDQIPWWAWTGGLLSIGSTLAGITLAQRLGSVTFTSLSIAASLTVAVLLDQFGWIGFRQHAASPGRLLGCGFLVLGAWLVSRY